MKSPTFAPLYACLLYPCLSEIANKHGYALAIHGSIQRDFDLIAIPWTNEASGDEELVKAIKDHIGSLYLHEKHERALDKPEQCDRNPENKPHGRKAWALHLEAGAYIDLSVMPKAK